MQQKNWKKYFDINKTEKNGRSVSYIKKFLSKSEGKYKVPIIC